MKRRNFIKTSAAGSAFFTTNSLFMFHKPEEPNILSNNLIDPLIPIRIFKNHEEEILSQIIEIRNKYGFRRFMILGPDKTVRFSGFPKPQVYRDIGKLILHVKEKLASYDIEVGWEYSTTIKQGPGMPYQYLTGLDGRTSEISYCPLDSDFKEIISNNIATVVSIARPFMIQMEDDFILGHAGFGCFCPLHLAEFAKRQQHPYSREELYQIFSNTTPESIILRRAWAELSRDSLVNLAILIRQKVDRIAPETRISLCQPGGSDFEGDFTELVTRSFAGKTRPAVRLYGSDYGNDHAEKLPEKIFHALYSSQHLPADFELYHESDTFPHTRFFMSSAKIKSLMTAAFAYGIDDSRFHPLQNTDNQLEDVGYSIMFKGEVKRFTALKAAVKDCKVDGCEIIYDPFEHIVDAYGKTSNKPFAWANVTGRLGIPHTASHGKVKMISGNTTEIMSDDAIIKLLSGSVFLDGKTAHSLCKRGFSELIGADVIPGGRPNFLYEGLHDPNDFQNITGRIMYNFILFGSVGSEGGSFFQLKPLYNAKILTDFLDGDEKPVTPGMIRFENKFGGRVAITAFDLNSNSSSAVINYKKKEIIRQTIEWLGREPLPIFVKYLPNTFCIFNKSISNNEAVVVLISLCSDVFESISLDVAPQWQNSMVELLNQDGEWMPAKVEIIDHTIKVKTKLSLMSPVILRFI